MSVTTISSRGTKTTNAAIKRWLVALGVFTTKRPVGLQLPSKLQAPLGTRESRVTWDSKKLMTLCGTVLYSSVE
jgi:hypothetical protein